MEPVARRSLPVQFKPVETDRMKAIQEDFPNYIDGLVRGSPGDFLFTPAYAEQAEDVYNFEVRPDDYWLLSFPKSGTHWMLELIWLIVHDCDFEKARKTKLMGRTYYLERKFLAPKKLAEKLATKDSDDKEVASSGQDQAVQTGASLSLDSLDEIKGLPSPRIIRSHLPLYLLPPDLLDKTKVVYVARNIKDIIVSAYFYHKTFKLHQFDKGIEEFVEYCFRDEALYCPYFPHILEAWKKRHHPNFLFVFYEDMKLDLAGQIRRVSEFLGKPVTAENVGKMVDYLTFDNFAKNESVNKESYKKMGTANQEGSFMRKGATGDWKNHFNPELNARIDQWIEKNLAGTDLKFTTELAQKD